MLNRVLPERAILVACVVIIAAFFAATALSQVIASRIDAASDALAFDSSPSIAHLVSVRGDVRNLQYQLDDYVDAHADGRKPDRTHVDKALGAVNDDVDAYLRLPLFPGENASWTDIHDALVALNTSVSRALTLVDEGAAHKAQRNVAGDVAIAADRTISAAITGIDFHAQNEALLSLRIKTMRRQVIVVDWSLTILAAMLAVLATVLVRRLVRRQALLYEEQTRFANRRAEELDAFAGRVAHDIMSPIGAAAMAVELVHRTTNEDKTRHLTDRALKSLYRSRTLMDDLLQFTRAAAEPEPGAHSDLRTVVNEVLADVMPAARQRGIAFEVDVASCTCTCTPGVLTSMVSNLVRNAVKYIGDAPVRRVRVSGTHAGDRCRFEVEDTGPGLAPGLREADVFRPLIRGRGTGQPGIGLGLATVKRLAEAHGGRVGCRSRPGEGATFWFDLPASEAHDAISSADAGASSLQSPEGDAQRPELPGHPTDKGGEGSG